MKIKIKINTKPVDFSKVDGICERKCKTCAYKSELLLEEKEYEKVSYKERGTDHTCVIITTENIVEEVTI